MPLNAPDREILERIQAAGSVHPDELLGAALPRANRLVKRGLLIRAYRDGWSIEIAKAGVAALTDFGRVEKPGRIYCLNPKCGCTADAAKADEIVCGKCWRLLPKPLRDDYRDLYALKGKLARRRAKRADGIVEVPLSAIGLESRISANWSRIRGFFLAPEMPEGLEAFFAEMGWSLDPPSLPEA